MQSANTIEISSISKRYMLGTRQSSMQLRERMVQFLKNPIGRERNSEAIWALRDVSFAVPQGEVVGIVGRNGAGKSTLLKILSRITHPTSGSIKVRGRVAALLEVGTGFHEELTGRENIYLNGSILGMKRRDIDRHFDAIVEFSGVSQFVDTPIKRYSSGMRLRLGFAVAAHLEPDVLVVDEVLAVGDAGFQKKCVAAMEGLRSGGRTVLFVSHNMAAVENLCSRGIWIDRGQVRMDGGARDVIKSYLTSYGGEQVRGTELQTEGRQGTGEIRFTAVEYLSPEGTAAGLLRSGDPVVIRLHYRAEKLVRLPSFGLRLFTEMGTLVTETSTWHHRLNIAEVPPAKGHIDLEIDALTLLPGHYSLSLWVTSDTGVPVYDGDVRAALEIEESDVYGGGRSLDSRYGVVYFPQKWKLAPAPVETASAVAVP